MNKEYDFSNGERSKFYHPEIEIYLPIYLEPEIIEFLTKFSEKKEIDISTIVNKWVKENISIVKTVI